MHSWNSLRCLFIYFVIVPSFLSFFLLRVRHEGGSRWGKYCCWCSRCQICGVYYSKESSGKHLYPQIWYLLVYCLYAYFQSTFYTKLVNKNRTAWLIPVLSRVFTASLIRSVFSCSAFFVSWRNMIYYCSPFFLMLVCLIIFDLSIGFYFLIFFNSRY